MGSSENRKIIGDYELLEVIGSGSQGQVYKAQCIAEGKSHIAKDDIVAIKILTQGSGDPTEDARFKREANILEQLDHPSICQYVDYFIENEGEMDERQCLVTEFIDGQALDERIKRYPRGLTWDEVKRIFEQVLAGLIYASERNVFHRDLKPSNIFITREGDAKIIDFGIARREGGEETTSGGFKGSFDYMAPDFVLVDGFRGDEHSDIFSLGVCFFKALTGGLPFDPLGENAQIGYLNRWKSEEPVRPSFRHNVFRVLTRIKPFITSCLATDPEERFQSFGEMLDGLAEIKFRIVRHKGKEDYELVDVLGRGGFGEVFKGRCLSNGKLVAVKHLFAGRQASRFIKEAKILQKYHHPDIVEYVDFIEVEGLGDDKEFFLVMEYFPGMPGSGLNQRIRKARFGLEPAEVIEIFMHYLSALKYLHESPRPIIHRDIKPGNLYAPPGQPQKAKLFDMGVARDVSGTMTTGMIPGTLDYMAPEFARPGSERGTPQSDIYAMGVSMYEALTGKKPFPRLPKSDQEAFVQFVARSQNPPEVNYRFPVFREIPQLEEIAQRSLHSDPAQRYVSAGQMLEDLTSLLETVAGEDVDAHDAPTRATIADPELIERLRAHQAGQPAFIPSSELNALLDEPSSKAEVQQRPDWMLEEEEETPDRGGPYPPAGSTPSGPVYSGPPMTGAAPPAAKGSFVRYASIGVVALGLLIGGYVVFKPNVDPRDQFLETVAEYSTVDPDEAYVWKLLSLLSRARELKIDDTGYEVWWDNQIAVISELGEKVPAAFEDRFSKAVAAEDLEEAKAASQAWENLSEAVVFMGLSQSEYIAQGSGMTDQIGRFEFMTAAANVRKALPAKLTSAAELPAAEAAGKQFRSLRARSWDEIPADEKTAQFSELEASLMKLASEYVEAEKKRVLEIYGRGEDGADGMAQLQQMETEAPSLVMLVEGDYRAALSALEASRESYQRLQAVAATVAKLNQAVPEQIQSAADLAQAEEAVVAYQAELSKPWEGIPKADKQATLDRIRTNLVARVNVYLDQLVAAAEDGYGKKEAAVPEDAELQAVGDLAPKLVALLNGGYADAVRQVDTARQERDTALKLAANEAEAQRMKAEAEAAAQAAALADQQRKEEMQKNRENFQQEVARIGGLAPEKVDSAAALAKAEEAVVAVDGLLGKSWPDVDLAQIESAAAELRSSLAEKVTAYVVALGKTATTRFEALEKSVPEWDELTAARYTAPILIALIDSAYEKSMAPAEAALRKQQGINAFTQALDKVRNAIPTRIETSGDLAIAEKTAKALQLIKTKDWEVVSEEDRTAAMARLQNSLQRKVTGYVTLLRDRALEQIGKQEDPTSTLNELKQLQKGAPILYQTVSTLADGAQTTVEAAYASMQVKQEFALALARVNDSMPPTLATESDRRNAEIAAKAYEFAAGRSWENIPEAERNAQLGERAAALRALVTTEIRALEKKARDAYENREDGGSAISELVALSKETPTLVAMAQDVYDTAGISVNESRKTFENIRTFTRAYQALLQSVPSTLTERGALAQAEKAAQTFEESKSKKWDDVPAAEKLSAFEEVRQALLNVGQGHVASLQDTAVSTYAKMGDADVQRDQLLGLKENAPTLVALLDRQYATAVQAVDEARNTKVKQEMQAAEQQRLAEEKRKEEERLAALRAAEEQRMQLVQNAWSTIQQSWKADDGADLSEAYQQVLSAASFEVEEMAAGYDQIRTSLLENLKSRLAGFIQQADSAISNYRAFTYQVMDPTFSGSYRVVDEDVPAVAFSLPQLDSVKDSSLGLTKAEMLRLQLWGKAGSSLNNPDTTRELANQLGKIAAAARQLGQLQLADLCRMESVMLTSEPAVFPSALEDAGEPLEIFRWRAHASYQPEGSALDALRDMERFATKKGTLNEYDLRLVLFASYYSWRNAIEGESEYAARVGKYLTGVLENASTQVSDQALAFLTDYIEGGADDEREFPGLYLLNALTMMQTNAPMAKNAGQWLKTNAGKYASRTQQIEPQMDLLRKLLKMP